MTADKTDTQTYDYVIIGSGFGGSVAAMRLVDKGYSVLVLERGKRFRDQDFPKTNLNLPKYLWMPALRCFGFFQISMFKDIWVLHGNGVGGGSLGYANVLEAPTDELFANPHWSHLADWKTILLPHLETARRMLGVTENPYQGPADAILQQITTDMGTGESFRPTRVGIFFGQPGQEGETVDDPFFDGQGPPRAGCNFCGGCMVGCRYNASNSLVKNYLYFAEKRGAQVWAESEVRDVRPLPAEQKDGARYAVVYRSATRWLHKPQKSVRARNVIFAAGSLGTQRLLFRCRDETRSLPRLSLRLGDAVRTNSESFLGVTARDDKVEYSRGIAITSIAQIDPVTRIEPVRYPSGSSLLRLLAGPMIESDGSVPKRVLKTIGHTFRHPLDFAYAQIIPGWAKRSTILMVMQTEDNHLHMRLGRDVYTPLRKNLVTHPDEDCAIPGTNPLGHQVARRFAGHVNGINQVTINEALLNVSLTAHILGGVPISLNDQDGVVGLDFQVHNYPGLYVVDGSIMPANPGVNPSLTITALAEYAMGLIPPV
jgi:cholesterol oxidase